MSVKQLDEEAIFHVARRIELGQTRSDYLEQVCGDNTALRARVDALLEANEESTEFLDPQWSAEHGSVDMAPVTESPGKMIGKYRLMEQIGEGGMGVVYVAQQQQPMRRKVALKIIKPGMDTKDVIARFEVERQALALMDHPNIARVLDAGTTDSGRPYFVMELVRGIPITEYCDLNKLSTRERLELFITVCHAVQHAHQKGVIHRDIKPSNVLITEHDGTPVAKVIDFGVAKAVNQRLTEHTLYTFFRQMVGTPLYMSPEQAELSGLDVDTRADIYSLGVLLYELVTGVTPFDRDRFTEAAYDEVRRIIREEEPPRPSTKISTLGQTADTISAHRGTDPRKLSQLLRGELDWIIMRALEKDRNRRYDTAAGLANDMKRFLDNEPVQARPPSTSYRVSKFVRRNRGVVAAATSLIAILIVGSIGTTTGWIAASAARQDAEHASTELERAIGTLKDVAFDHAITNAMVGDEDKGAEAIEAAKLAGASEAELAFLEGQLAFFTGGDFVQKLRRAVEIDQNGLAANALFAQACGLEGLDEEWLQARDRMEHLPAKTQKDYLFKAYALAADDPRRGLALLKRAIQKRGSPAALVIRTQNKIELALATGDAALADEAVTDARNVQFLLGKNPLAVWTQLYALNAAYQVNRVTGDVETANCHLDNARLVATELAAFPEYRIGIYSRYLHAANAGAASTEWNMVRQLGGTNGYFIHLIAANRLRVAKDPKSALVDFDAAVTTQGPVTDSARAHLLAQIPSHRESGQVESIVNELFAKSQSPLIHSYLPELVCYLGDPDLVRDLARTIVESSALEKLPQSWAAVPALEYMAGKISEDELLKKADSAWSSLSRLNAHYRIGLMFMAKGHKQRAKQHFQECLNTGCYNRHLFDFARAYVARMEHDPNWPNWIPRREDGELK